MVLLFARYYCHDQDEDDQMGAACGTSGKEGKCLKSIGWKP